MIIVTMNTGLKGARVSVIEKLLKQEFPGFAVQVKRVDDSPSRATRYASAMAKIGEAQSEIESLKEELEQWRDGLPENLQYGSKADKLDDAISDLEDVITNLEESGVDINFPSMMG